MHLKDFLCKKTIFLSLMAVGVIFVPNFLVHQEFFVGTKIPVTLPDKHLQAPIEPFLSHENERAKALLREVDQYWHNQQKAANETLRLLESQKTVLESQKAIEAPQESQEKAGKIRIPWVLSIEDFQHYDLAHPLMERLKAEGWRSFVMVEKEEGVSIYRVMVGPYIRYEDALTAQEKIVLTSEETAVHSPIKLDD